MASRPPAKFPFFHLVLGHGETKIAIIFSWYSPYLFQGKKQPYRINLRLFIYLVCNGMNGEERPLIAPRPKINLFFWI